MAQGDITVFDEAKAKMLDGGWGASDQIYIALVTNSPAPAASTATPTLGDFTEVSAGGNYSAGGSLLDTIANMVTEASGTMTFDDTGSSVTWSQSSSNPANARYAIIYNNTQSGNSAIAFVDLGSSIDMTAGDLTITWNASGIFTIA